MKSLGVSPLPARIALPRAGCMISAAPRLSPKDQIKM